MQCNIAPLQKQRNGDEMDLYERCLRREDKFRGRILDVHVDTVSLPNGKTALRETADHPGGVAVVAIDSEGMLLTVKQYRYAFSRVMEEIPAGKLEKGEDPYAAALRELKEETGAAAERLISLGSIVPSPGCYGETLYLYLADQLRFGEAEPDEDEFLSLCRTPFRDAIAKVMSGELDDAKTVVGILKAKELLGK